MLQVILENPQSILFTIFAAVAITSALGVVLHNNPVTSAVLLVLTFFALAGIYAILNAVFIATMQVLVYAGAIMVLVVFVLMLLSLREESRLILWEKPVKKVALLFVVFFFAVILFSAFQMGSPNAIVATKGYTQSISSDSVSVDASFTKTEQGETLRYDYSYAIGESGVKADGNTASVGASMFLDYLLPFEMISLLLLTAVIGAVILAKKKVEDNV